MGSARWSPRLAAIVAAAILPACGPATSAPGPGQHAYPTVSHLVLATGGQLFCNAPANAPIGHADIIAVNSASDLYIADLTADHVYRLGASGAVSVFAGNGGMRFHRQNEGQLATTVPFQPSTGLAFDAAGNVYMSEALGHVARVGTNGRIYNVAGRDEILAFSGDGGLAKNADINQPLGLLVDPAGNLYIADSLNNRVRRVGPDGRIATVAGNGIDGEDGDGGLAMAAKVGLPDGLAIDATGNLFIESKDRVRKVTREGMITTVAGSGATLPRGASQDFAGMEGPATQATILGIQGIALDNRGNLYLNSGQPTGGLFVVTPDGIIHLVVAATTGNVTNEITDVAADPAGNIYYASHCGVYRLSWN